MFFHTSYPIFPFLRVLCSERFFFSRFWADQIGNQKLLSPVKSLFVNARILFACRRKKSDAKFQRASCNLFPLYPYIPFFPQTTFPRRSGVLRKGFPQIFSPVQAYVGFWVFNRSRTAFAVFESQARFSRAYVCVRACAFVCGFSLARRARGWAFFCYPFFGHDRNE